MHKSDLANLLLIIIFGALIYLISLLAPFQFDDFPHIVENPHIKNLSDLGAIWNHWPSRFFGFLTFAGNYALCGLNPAGYRLVNLTIHAAGAVFAYLLVKLLAGLSGAGDEKARITAFWTAMVFICHPLQTQAVTYIVQRFVSLAGTLSLAAVFCYFQARKKISAGASFNSFSHLAYYGGGIILSLLAMTSKESAVSLPILILSLELLFPPRDTIWRRRIMYLLPYLSTLLVVPALSLYMATGRGSNPFYYKLNFAASGGTGFYVSAQSVFLDSRLQYLLTQLHAFLIYLRLCILPVKQSIWYDLPLSRSLFSSGTYLALLVIGGLVIVALRAIRRLPLITVAIIWFFFNLAPTSSGAVIWPFLSEHHMYLPVFSWALMIGVWLGWLSERFRRERIMFPAWILIFCLALLAGRRNILWGDTYRLWEDALRTAPASGPIHTAMSAALIRAGRYEDAIEPAQRAIEINPRVESSYHNLWAAYFNLNRLAEAKALADHYAEVFPDSSKPYVNIGMTLMKNGEYAEAGEFLQEALAKDPDDMSAHYWLGVNLLEMDDEAGALEHLKKALTLNPDFSPVYDYLGRVYQLMGEGDQALEIYSLGVSRFPQSLLLRYNLAMLAWELGDFDLAEKYLVECLSLPGDDSQEKMLTAALDELRAQMTP